jgi:hypothetical protein
MNAKHWGAGFCVKADEIAVLVRIFGLGRAASPLSTLDGEVESVFEEEGTGAVTELRTDGSQVFQVARPDFILQRTLPVSASMHMPYSFSKFGPFDTTNTLSPTTTGVAELSPGISTDQRMELGWLMSEGRL